MLKYLYILLFTFYLFAEAKTLAIFAFKHHETKPWDTSSLKSGITGSEEAIIYLSKELVSLGYKVVIFADPPQNSKDTLPNANPRFTTYENDKTSTFDIGIVWRLPQIAPYVKMRAKKLILWPHDTLDGKLPDEITNCFSGVLWLSEWQRAQWCSLCPAFSKFSPIFGNGIKPETFQTVTPRENPYSCIYGSNYARGLELLIDAWPMVKKLFPRATLDIYYGWQHFGLLSLEGEKKLRQKVANIKHLDVIDHGLVGQDELARAYEKASFWTYPCTAPETFCITALKAQLAGAIPVIIEGSALKETVRHGYKCHHPNEYLTTLLFALQNAEKIPLEERKSLGAFILKEFTWEGVARKCDSYFKNS